MSFTSRTIIIVTALIFLVGLIFLYIWEAKNRNYDYRKSWSAVYFNNPNDDSLIFTIENHENKDANYQIKFFVEGKARNESEVVVPSSQKRIFDPKIDKGEVENVSIEVRTDQKKYNLSKSFK